MLDKLAVGGAEPIQKFYILVWEAKVKTMWVGWGQVIVGWVLVESDSKAS